MESEVPLEKTAKNGTMLNHVATSSPAGSQGGYIHQSHHFDDDELTDLVLHNEDVLRENLKDFDSNEFGEYKSPQYHKTGQIDHEDSVVQNNDTNWGTKKEEPTDSVKIEQGQSKASKSQDNIDGASDSNTQIQNKEFVIPESGSDGGKEFPAEYDEDEFIPTDPTSLDFLPTEIKIVHISNKYTKKNDNLQTGETQVDSNVQDSDIDNSDRKYIPNTETMDSSSEFDSVEDWPDIKSSRSPSGMHHHHSKDKEPDEVVPRKASNSERDDTMEEEVKPGQARSHLHHKVKSRHNRRFKVRVLIDKRKGKQKVLLK